MEWIILEALVALALGLAIVWWTLSPARRREREQEKRDADSGERDDERNDVAARLMQRARNRERELRDRRIERAAILGEHLVRAPHRADGGREARAARVLERLAGLQDRLLADDADALHFLDALVRVDDHPVPARRAAPRPFPCS